MTGEDLFNWVEEHEKEKMTKHTVVDRKDSADFFEMLVE